MLKLFFTPPSPKQAVWELIFAASLWGFGFIATRWGLDFASPSWLNAIRFSLAFLAALPFLLWQPFFRQFDLKRLFYLALLPGSLLGLSILLQTIGLEYTTVTKSSFITVLYIVLVPFLERLLLKTPIHPLHFLWVGLALVGSALICEFQGGEWNRGDVITLGCALMAAFQIVLLEKFSNRIDSPFAFNVFQSFWAGVLPLILALTLSPVPKMPIPLHSLVGFFQLAFGSSLLAFFIQVRCQKVISSSIVSMLFLLESPFGAFFAFIFLGETMSLSQWIGGACILIAAGGSVRVHRWIQLPQSPSHRN